MARFCMRCGAPLSPHKQFCTCCGYPVSFKSDGNRDANKRVQNPRRDERARGGLVLGVISLVVALLVIGTGVFVWMSGGIEAALARLLPQLESEPYVVSREFASLKSVEVASTTHIVPQVSDGGSAVSYQVRIKQADDLSGTFVTVDELPTVSVTGLEGFSLSDFGSLGSGTYYLGMETSAGVTLDLPPLRLGDSVSAEELPDEVEIIMPVNVEEETALSRRGKYRAFSDVLSSLTDSYGGSSLTVMKLDDEQFLVWAAGVSYAEIVDFGDGVERLVVAYCLDGSFSNSDVVEVEEGASAGDFGPKARNYRVEIYEYDLISDEVVMVCQMTPEATEEGRATLRYLKSPDNRLCLVAENQSSDANVCYGIDDVGTFGVLSQDGDALAQWPAERVYHFFSVATTQEQALNGAENGEVSCEEMAQAVNDLASRLSGLSDV